MKLPVIAVATALTMSIAGPLLAADSWSPGDDCVSNNHFSFLEDGETKFIYPVGPELVSAQYFIPAGATADFVLKAPYNKDLWYFAKLEVPRSKATPKYFGGRNYTTAKKIPDDHYLVEKGVADKTDTLVSLFVPPGAGSYWKTARVYIYACDRGEPRAVSQITKRVSSSLWSAVLVVGIAALTYLFAAITTKTLYTNQLPWFRYLDPVMLTAGPDGRGSLGKLQILFFSAIVFGLLSFIVARTGILSDISATILTLLGIAAVGSTASKMADAQKNRIDFDSWTWFTLRAWLPKAGLASVNDAKWRDIVLNKDGEFDVYRYQSCIFTLVVGGALITAGIYELAKFSIPESVLGVLGLSQVVYVAGKLVSPTSATDLNSSSKQLRDLEDAFRAAARANPDPNPPPNAQPTDSPQDLAASIRRAPNEYRKFAEAAEKVRIGLQSLTGYEVPSPAPPPLY